MTQIIKTKYQNSKDYFLIYNELITAAQYRRTFTYQEIAQIMGLPLVGSYMGKEIGQMLGEISNNEVENKRPMLSSIAVGVSGEPGDGFYNFAETLYKKSFETVEERKEFWHQEMERVYQEWAIELEPS